MIFCLKWHVYHVCSVGNVFTAPISFKVRLGISKIERVISANTLEIFWKCSYSDECHRSLRRSPQKSLFLLTSIFYTKAQNSDAAINNENNHRFCTIMLSEYWFKTHLILKAINSFSWLLNNLDGVKQQQILGWWVARKTQAHFLNLEEEKKHKLMSLTSPGHNYEAILYASPSFLTLDEILNNPSTMPYVERLDCVLEVLFLIIKWSSWWCGLRINQSVIHGLKLAENCVKINLLIHQGNFGGFWRRWKYQKVF